MRVGEIFILGTIAGAVAVWLWGRELEHYWGEKTRGVRAQAAAGMQAMDETTGRVLDHGGRSLRRAEDFLQDAKEHVSDALRAGQRAVRPDPTSDKT
jgi:hypothetical protein